MKAGRKHFSNVHCVGLSILSALLCAKTKRGQKFQKHFKFAKRATP